MSPLVTIITPTYNREATLPRAIDSVLAQDFSDWELVIVDDGSTDDTAALVSSYTDSRIRFVEHEENRGVAAAKNTGLDEIRGEFFSTLDSDDELKPGALSRLLDVFALHPDVDQVICNCEEWGTGRLHSSGIDQEGYVDESNVVPVGEFWSLTRTYTLGASRHDPALNGFEEVLWYELAERQVRYFIPDALRIYHTEGANRVSQGGGGSRYDSFMHVIDSRPDHLERLTLRAPAVRAQFWFAAGVESAWVGDRAMASRALGEVKDTGAVGLGRIALLELGALLGPRVFRVVFRCAATLRDAWRRIAPRG